MTSQALTPGILARRLLGERWLPPIGRFYRGLFVNLGMVADEMEPLLEGSHFLDIGAGDGELENLLLRRNPGLTATLIDLAPNVGAWLSKDVRNRAEVLSGVSVSDYLCLNRPPPELVILSDVIHHVPPEQRAPLFEQIRSLLGDRPARLLIKDVEPGSPRAALCFLADRYITGDPNVSFVSRSELRALIESVFPGARCQETALFERNPPNYCLAFWISAARVKEERSAEEPRVGPPVR